MLHRDNLRPSPLPCFPADHALLGPLVIPEPEEHWLTQQAFFGPFGKLDLTHQPRLDPASARLLRENAATGGHFPPDALERGPDRGQLMIGKSAAGPAAVHELPVAKSTEMQGTEATPASLRRTEADDDKVLSPPGTYFHPGS